MLIVHKETEELFIKDCVRNEIHIVIRYIGKTVLLILDKRCYICIILSYRWRLDSLYVN